VWASTCSKRSKQGSKQHNSGPALHKEWEPAERQRRTNQYCYGEVGVRGDKNLVQLRSDNLITCILAKLAKAWLYQASQADTAQACEASAVLQFQEGPETQPAYSPAASICLLLSVPHLCSADTLQRPLAGSAPGVCSPRLDLRPVGSARVRHRIAASRHHGSGGCASIPKSRDEVAQLGGARTVENSIQC
jgi:hypothetical protein